MAGNKTDMIEIEIIYYLYHVIIVTDILNLHPHTPFSFNVFPVVQEGNLFVDDFGNLVSLQGIKMFSLYYR